MAVVHLEPVQGIKELPVPPLGAMSTPLAMETHPQITLVRPALMGAQRKVDCTELAVISKAVEVAAAMRPMATAVLVLADWCNSPTTNILDHFLQFQG